MGLLAAIKTLAYGFLVAFNWVYAIVFRHTKLHAARFARIDELANLTSGVPDQEGSGLILGVSHLKNVLRVKPTSSRRELGNLLVVAPTRGGKGLLATAQLLSWKHSVIVNDIKGDLFTQTAGYRSTLGPVFVIDPTGVGHRYDPLHGRHTEDELLSAATHLLFKPDEGDGAIFTSNRHADPILSCRPGGGDSPYALCAPNDPRRSSQSSPQTQRALHRTCHTVSRCGV